MSAEDYHEKVVFFVATIEGTDDTFLQTVTANHVYKASDIEYGAQFVDMIELANEAKGRKLILRHENLSKTMPFNMDQPSESVKESVDDLETS
jgi:hypothetical protein